jgi:hypothetical protein
MRTFSAISIALLTSALIVGCRGSDAGPVGGGSANQSVRREPAPSGEVGHPTPTSSAGGSTTESSGAVWPSDATALRVDDRGGGFVGPGPDGAECSRGEAHYTLDIKTLALTSKRCTERGDNAPLRFVTTSRTLSPTEYLDVDAAMKALSTTNDPSQCGADKPELDVTVASPRGEMTYYDDFYACQGGEKTYVANIDGVFEVFAKLARLPPM